MKTLETKRLILRDWNCDDFGCEVYDTKAIQYLISAKNNYALVLKDNNTVIGSIGLNEDAENDPDVKNVGIILLEAYRNKGLMSEALGCVFANAEDGANKFSYVCDINNKRSQHMAEKFGFRYIKTINNMQKDPNETPADLFYYRLDISDSLKYYEALIDERNDFTDVQSITEAERLGRLYPIILENHNPAWKEQYEQQKKYLCEIFGDSVLRISHIGSTAVPGLISKPTVDILLEIKEDIDLTQITDIFQNNGYIVNRPPNDIIMYIKGYGDKGFEGQVFHIHVRKLGDYNELYFRDYLKAHPEAAKEYGELKKILKEKFEHDRDGYTTAKGDFIMKITAAARDEFGDKYK